MMFKFIDTIEEFTVEVDSSCNYMKIQVKLGSSMHTILEDIFENQRTMGEYLSDYIGNNLATELLRRNNVEKSEPIWLLNQKG